MIRFDDFVSNLSKETRDSVVRACRRVAGARKTTLESVFDDVDAARHQAAAVKDFVLGNLRPLLQQFEHQCLSNGINVHWAESAAQARELVTSLCRQKAAHGATVVKAKSMATEEIHLNDALQQAGFDVVETDLGEFVVQVDGDTPSHIVAPIIHKNRRQVAESFRREGLGPYTENPEALAMQARQHLRKKFQKAEIGISGVNFGVAETGRLVLVENEGNNRLSTTAPRVHIAVMGLEKLLPRDSDLPLFLRLLAGSATGQRLTVYTHLIKRPRLTGELDGPDEIHLVLLDNGRTKVLNGPYRAILRCIRCGACLNACPVYRHSSGHAYGHVYSGPVGAVLAPATEGVEKMGHLAKASTLCGACEEVCPVSIPIPQMLLRLRDEACRAGTGERGMPWWALAELAKRDRIWRAVLRVLPLTASLPNPWTKVRENPIKVGRDFRRWFRERP